MPKRVKQLTPEVELVEDQKSLAQAVDQKIGHASDVVKRTADDEAAWQRLHPPIDSVSDEQIDDLLLKALRLQPASMPNLPKPQAGLYLIAPCAMQLFRNNWTTERALQRVFHRLRILGAIEVLNEPGGKNSHFVLPGHTPGVPSGWLPPSELRTEFAYRSWLKIEPTTTD